MAEHNDLGHWGEERAAEYMEKKGWYVKERDWRHGNTDIDLICIDEDDTTLVFVEVKTRSTDDYGEPYEAVNAEKRRHIVSAAAHYKSIFRKENRRTRYDIISIVGSPHGTIKIEHIEDAFDMLDLYEDYNVRPTSWRRRH
ncbi:YraN family protein [Prevotella sp. PINT]|jgi:Predicted endonuclease distantly related to archaeal Holliday junction resolvase|uniref:YraN family protein n=1 Tax=Palleniella intestinalis TaxID=2736291 RepID=UPI0015558DD5|nr:YraN family protein [Palleniella intestinalis]NPD81220.1 YraN family protein [Palleniella intestinalis]